MHYYANDANFNVTALVEPDGDVAVRYAYDPYGRVTLLAPDFGDPGGMDLPPNTLYFTGHRLEAETGLYLTPYRPYHYGLGRWLQRDPIGYGDGMGLYEYASARPLQVVDPSGHCSCTQEEVKEKFLAKLKVNVMPGSLDVAIGAAQECDTPADIGRPCTATVTYAVSRPMNWDPQNPGDPTSPRMSLMAKCRSRMRLVCACGEWRVPGLDWVVWSNYYWEYGPGANPEALSANVCIFREWWEIDETRVRLRRLYNDILRWISPGWEDWPSWMIDPYNAVGRLLGIGVIKSTEPDDFLTGRGEYRYNEIFRGDYGPGKAAQQMCVDGVEGG